MSFLATIIIPDVSLSSLWTIPGLISPPIPDKLFLHIANIAFTNVPSGFPLAGWTTNPFGLFTTIISLSSYIISIGIFSASNLVSFAFGTFIQISSFAWTL